MDAITGIQITRKNKLTINIMYELITRKSTGTKGIKCLDCNGISYNANDVKYKYCACCHKFHEQPPALKGASPSSLIPLGSGLPHQ